MQIVAITDVGNLRTVNQDYVRYYQKNNHECLIVLCDGMGGHNAGEIASQMTCDDIIEHYINQEMSDNESEIQIWMQAIIHHAHEKVKIKSYESDELEGMGTTVVLALVKNGNVYISHVGDSRAYICRHHDLFQVTKDDTLVNVLIETGSISKEEAKFHPQKNILLQAVGVSDVLKISFYKASLQDEMILICSDGLYNSLSDQQIVDICMKQQTLEEIGNELMKEAKMYGGKDNIGFAMISMERDNENESNK